MTFTDDVLAEMSRVWTSKPYCLTVTDDLLFNWRSITEAILDHAEENLAGNKPAILRLVNAETGTGKTTLITVLLGMMGRHDLKHRVLFMTAFKEEATRLAQAINAITEKRDYAIAQHGDHKWAYGRSRHYPCKVITTNAYIRGLNDNERMDALYACDDGVRNITLFDEALSPVSVYKMTSASAGSFFADLPESIIMNDKLAETAFVLEEYRKARERFLETGIGTPEPFALPRNFDVLRQAIKGSYDMDEEAKHAFEDKVAMLKAFAAATASRLIAPEGANAHGMYAGVHQPIFHRSAVILDATADLNLAYALLPSGTVQWVPVRKIRQYPDVILRAVVNTATGKGKIEAEPDIRLDHLWNRTVLHRLDGPTAIVSHKGVENAFNALFRKEAEKHNANPGMLFGYYGKLNGLNKMKDCTNLLALSWPHMTEGWAIVLFEALHGTQSPEWRAGKVIREWTDNRGITHDDIIRAILEGQAAHTVVQEINRICIRKNTGTNGSCPPASIVHIWPSGSRYFKPMAILDMVMDTMSGMKVVSDYGYDWPG